MEKWCSLVLLFDREVFYLIWVILEEWCYGWVFFLTSYDVIWTQNQYVSYLLFIVGVCIDLKHIPLIEPMRELCNYHFYHFAISYSSVVLSNKRTCHVIFFDSLFLWWRKRKTKNRASQLSLLPIVFQSVKIW